MLAKILESILRKNKLKNKKNLFILGISGGPDSMVLLSLFYKMGIKAVVAHVNYKKRAEADSDEELVRSFCKRNNSSKLNYEFEVKHADFREASRNFQNWARNERRTFFSDLKVKYKADAIVTAHHEDDQLETLMQKVLRGSSLNAWKGISEYDGTYLRPLLSVSKKSILDYADKYSIPFSIDVSNLESSYARNFIRNEWKPELDRLFPGWQANILRLTERAEAYQEMLELMLNQISRGEDSLDRTGYLNLKQNTQKAVILEKIRQLYPGNKVATSALDNMNLNDLQTGQLAQISSNISVIRNRKTFSIIKDTNVITYCYTLTLRELDKEPAILNGCKFSIQSFANPDYEKKLYLNVEKLSDQLIFRSWKAGDRFRPFGFQGTKKLSDYLTEKKINTLYKNNTGVIVSFDVNICAVIFPYSMYKSHIGEIDEHVRCNGENQKCLVIERITDFDER